MNRFILLLLVLLPGCPGPDMLVTPADSGPIQGDAGPTMGDAAPDAYMAPEQDSGVDSGPDAGSPVIDGGTDAATVADAGPLHLEDYEVSWGMWAWFETAGRPDGSGGVVAPPSAETGCTDGLGGSYPVTCISLESASAFCLWRGQTLPSRAEWLADAEHMPSAHEITGTTMPNYTIHDGGCASDGACNIRGNVAELTSDGYAMGAAFDDASPGLGERPAANSPQIGFRCRTL